MPAPTFVPVPDGGSPAGAGTLADARREARDRRISMIRRRVAGGGAALFVALFLLIAIRLASGHDPALSRTAAASGSSANANAVYALPRDDGSLYQGGTNGQAGNGGGAAIQNGGSSSQSSGSPLTTRQS
jgi:hypothetical protein